MTKHDNVSQGKIMKATEFVKEHGIEKAREGVDSAPESSTLVFYHFDVINNELLGPEYYRDGGSQHFDKDNKSWGFCVDPQTRVAEPHDALESLFDLKRLVESHELVERCGGLNSLKAWVKETKSKLSLATYFHCNKPLVLIQIEKAEQAIADVEACHEVN